ncbi:hypothetical protein HDE_04251 [Halotydeus destructor]|nr:hypothetical protein HDE_04251 [Halotydeus destructor]
MRSVWRQTQCLSKSVTWTELKSQLRTTKVLSRLEISDPQQNVQIPNSTHRYQLENAIGFLFPKYNTKRFETWDGAGQNPADTREGVVSEDQWKSHVGNLMFTRDRRMLSFIRDNQI